MMKSKLLLRGQMVKTRPAPFGLPLTYTYGTLCGHASFLFLGCAYLESDLLRLRVMAMGGIACSILFQYYRTVVLWLPLRWNLLFLGINSFMVVVIMAETSETIPDEWAALYNGVFKTRGVKPSDFLRLMNTATRVEVKKGEKIITAGEGTKGLYLIQSGRVTVKTKTGDDTIHPLQFAGVLSYLNYLKRDPANVKTGRKRKEVEMKKAYSEMHGEYTTLSHFIPMGGTKGDKARPPPAAFEEIDVGLADVIAEDACVLFLFEFEDLFELEHAHPNIGLAIERAVHSDITRRFSKRML